MRKLTRNAALFAIVAMCFAVLGGQEAEAGIFDFLKRHKSCCAPAPTCHKTDAIKLSLFTVQSLLQSRPVTSQRQLAANQHRLVANQHRLVVHQNQLVPNHTPKRRKQLPPHRKRRAFMTDLAAKQRLKLWLPNSSCVQLAMRKSTSFVKAPTKSGSQKTAMLPSFKST